jgi:hypothetical protein
MKIIGKYNAGRMDLITNSHCGRNVYIILIAEYHTQYYGTWRCGVNEQPDMSGLRFVDEIPVSRGTRPSKYSALYESLLQMVKENTRQWAMLPAEDKEHANKLRNLIYNYSRRHDILVQTAVRREENTWFACYRLK